MRGGRKRSEGTTKGYPATDKCSRVRDIRADDVGSVLASSSVAILVQLVLDSLLCGPVNGD